MAAKHSNREHAFLSASGAKRWMTCPPSAHLQGKFEDKQNAASDEGTLAHELSEVILKYKLGRLAEKLYKRDLAAIKSNQYYSKAMWDHVGDYVAYVLKRYSEAKAIDKSAILLIEHRYDLTAYIPKGFGTGDIVIVCSKWQLCIDFKYGTGVEVSAYENEQQKIYSLGAYLDFGNLYDFETVEMVIHQPRLDNISTFKMPVKKLLSWGKNELKPAAQLAWDNGGELVAGSHCQFCRAKATCSALAKYANQTARNEFMNPHELTDEQIIENLKRFSVITNWMNAIQEYVLEQALKHGKKWPGYKLVSGRSSRSYTKIKKIEKSLLAIGYTREQIYEPETLLGITAMEKLIGKKDFNKHVSAFTVKSEGKPTLVPISDKRPEINSNDAARRDFENVD